MNFQPPATRPKRVVSPKWALVLIALLGIITVHGVNNNSIVSADTSNPTTVKLSDQLSKLNNYVAIKNGYKSPLIYSKAFLLLDSQSAEPIIGKNADLSVPIASTTKMTTALVAMENFPLDKVITVPSGPSQVEGSKINLVQGEQMTVANLLKGLLINSGNDAAFTLAEAYSGKKGDYSQFVTAMNKFAIDHHLNNTRFSDPAGLDDDTGRSTAQDLANIARLLLNNPTLASIVSTPEATITSTDGRIIHPLKNTNRLIETANAYYLPAALGIKTGYTPAAGHCLISAYQWQGRILIGVVMNTNESTNSASAAEMNKLFRWAEGALEVRAY